MWTIDGIIMRNVQTAPYSWGLTYIGSESYPGFETEVGFPIQISGYTCSGILHFRNNRQNYTATLGLSRHAHGFLNADQYKNTKYKTYYVKEID